MKVLVGECTGPRALSKLRPHGWGRLWIARGRNIEAYDGEPWGLDNGAYRDFLAGEPFNGDTFLRVLDKARDVRPSPLMVVLPDIVAGGEKSLDLSLEWLGKPLGVWPWYLAVQNGIEPERVDALRLPISGIFLGGDNKYKARAGEWCAFAHERRLRFHYGRCGTLRKVDHAKRVGADSIDSAFPMWTEHRWRVFSDRVRNGSAQLVIGESASKKEDAP